VPKNLLGLEVGSTKSNDLSERCLDLLGLWTPHLLCLFPFCCLILTTSKGVTKKVLIKLDKKELVMMMLGSLSLFIEVLFENKFL
jgi:hypothetical protein